MEVLLSILIGAISSIIASFIFFRVFRLIKPKIDISPNITRFYSSSGGIVYGIKIINRSRRPAVNIKAEFHLTYISNLSNGPITLTKDLKLKRDTNFILEGYRKDKAEEDYAFRFLTYEDIEKEVINKTKECHIRISILAYNELSGLGKVFTKEYALSDIIEGRFQQGDSFKIIKDNKTNP